MEWHRVPYFVTDERARLDLDALHAYLARSYWARAIPRRVVERSLEHSLGFGLFRANAEAPRPVQVGFARVISDRVTFAYVCDVYVLEEERGRGLGAFLIECIHAHPELQDLRRWLLVTRDAHALYAPFGWRVTPEPEGHMEIVKPDPYLCP